MVTFGNWSSLLDMDMYQNRSVSARPSCGPEAPPCALHWTAISCPNSDCWTDCGSDPQCVCPVCLGPVAGGALRSSLSTQVESSGIACQLNLGNSLLGEHPCQCFFWKLPDMFDLGFRWGILGGWSRLVGSRQENMYESSLSRC